MVRIALALITAIGLSACIPPGAQRADVDNPPPVAGPSPTRHSPAARPPVQQRAQQSPPAEQDVRVLPAPPQAWEARRVTADARQVSSTTYLVQPGDTLRSLADKTGAGSEAIVRANKLVAPYVVFPGQRLTIPGGRYHLVRAGESGIAIARAYGIDWARIVAANALAEPYLLRTGQRLLIPSSSTSPTQSREERAAAFHIEIDDLLTGSQPALARAEKPAKPSASPKRVLPPTTAVAPPAHLVGQFAWPVRGPVVRRFGPGASGERNDGIKIAVPASTPILAAADGVVAYVGNDVPALGGLVILTHGNGWTTVYGYASRLLVQRGQSVKKGQKIALSGSTGFADRPELHFEIRKGRTPVDPVQRLPSAR
ncbi:MAG: M23 family metallopeptidase [Sphingomonas sp.]